MTSIINFNKDCKNDSIIEFKAEQVQLIKDQVMPGATDSELAYFIYYCEKRGLNPLNGEIYAVQRWDKRIRKLKFTPQVGIAGLRIIAMRTGDYLGPLPTMWCNSKGEWFDCWIFDFPPTACKVGVRRKGWEEPVLGIARYDAYVQKDTTDKVLPFWAKYESHMLEKVAESLALRRAFPQELSGVYSTEEMGEDEEVKTVTNEKPVQKLLTSNPVKNIEQRIENMLKLFQTFNISKEQLENHVGVEVDEFAEMEFNECRALLKGIRDGKIDVQQFIVENEHSEKADITSADTREDLPQEQNRTVDKTHFNSINNNNDIHKDVSLPS